MVKMLINLYFGKMCVHSTFSFTVLLSLLQPYQGGKHRPSVWLPVFAYIETVTATPLAR